MFMLQKGRIFLPPQDMIDRLRQHGSATATQLLSVREDVVLNRTDLLAPEEPLEIRVQGPDQDALSVAVTMRTPGNDDELTIGFLYTEGLIRSRTEIVNIEANTLRLDGQPCNIATVTLAHPFDLAPLKRNFYATSSCGICGKASLEQISVHCDPVAPGSVMARSIIVDLPHALRQAQQLFAQTGGLHATGLFDLTSSLLLLREDVGRHNAVDKVVGYRVLAGESSLANQVRIYKYLGLTHSESRCNDRSLALMPHSRARASPAPLTRTSTTQNRSSKPSLTRVNLLDIALPTARDHHGSQ